MKIFFTKKEYRLLIDMISLSDWMMNSNTIGPETANLDHILLYQKLLSYSKEMQADDIVEPDKKSGKYYHTNEYDEELHDKYIAPYDEHVFWEELMTALGDRDFLRKFGQERIEAMSRKERFILSERVRDKYIDEFNEHGIENIVIDNKDFTIEDVDE